ncbi:2-oxoglutarate and oxygenase superfamily protein [Perilla frutescens var. frutescens]|nr:2-oxoglutarate and oxygenase superfamily protein [Perilla frutescens var. frutescens]
MVEVGGEFILPPEHRPKPERIDADNIPLIDLSEPDSEILAAEIGNACKNWGFFQVINHGVPSECREKIESASRKFFSLPKEEKKEVSRDEINPYGYYDSEHTKNVRDWKEILDCSAQSSTILPTSHLVDDTELKEFGNKWPRSLPELREAVEEFVVQVEKVALKLLELVAMSLGLRRDRLNAYFNDQSSRVKLNYYPPCPHPHLALGTGRHKDGGALTILAQDSVGGLEVKRQTDGEWILVKPIHDAYIINVGDMIQVWSNDRYKSIEHRATVDSEKERFSIAFFFNPAHYTWVQPVDELVTEENPSRYRGYNWGKFIVTRNWGNFKKLDVKNIQISDFRI